MRILKMQPKFFQEFIESLNKFGTIYGPVKKDGVLKYDRVEAFDEVVFDGERPMIPIKKLFHPKKFDMFHFDKDGFTPDYSSIEKRVIIGVPPCEIHSLLRLDEIFMERPVDPYYAKQRENSAIIGYSCLPGESCFCKSTGTDIVEEGFDLFFVNLGKFYLVWVGSSLGHDMVLEREDYFDENVTHNDIEEYIDWRQARDKMFKASFDFKSMPDIMELSYNSPIWDYFADKCLSCGQCSMVCPTCNCYTVTDVLEVSPDTKGRRERYWDSCMFVDYSLVAGGHNFRGARADRLKLWYTHKLKAYANEYGKPACIGCGRCVRTCPVDINVLTVAQALTEMEVPAQ
ncbi:MAG: 4Fe-4S dicluster domain-containing protein [Candidatus Thorarchaeota archaeon]|nr:4Fe-4S dicluster domain-containing protein [Candidatus Thorarchaeota archaeon]